MPLFRSKVALGVLLRQIAPTASRSEVQGRSFTYRRAPPDLPACSRRIIERELQYTANTYNTLPVTLCRGEGVFMWDTTGKRYYDMLAGYSALSLGHCHPALVEALTQQAARLHLTSRAFHNDAFADYAEYVVKYFGYEKVLPMNTGVEAGDAAIKIARKWGYKVKGIEKDRAKVVFAENNFWGRSLAAISASNDPESYGNYGPLMPNFLSVPYDDLESLERALTDPTVCAFMVEPIQGEAGIVIPSEGYLRGVRRLCLERNVLMIADEVQTGIGRTGRVLCCDHEAVKPDLLVLGKALSGGMYPVSAVLGSYHVMSVMEPGTHGSTYGGNPLACAVATAALRETWRRGLETNARVVGEYCLSRLTALARRGGAVRGARGLGLMMALEVEERAVDAWRLCLALRDAGVLAKPTHGHIVRLCPPLILTIDQAEDALDIIERVVHEQENLAR